MLHAACVLHNFCLLHDDFDDGCMLDGGNDDDPDDEQHCPDVGADQKRTYLMNIICACH